MVHEPYRSDSDRIVVAKDRLVMDIDIEIKAIQAESEATKDLPLPGDARGLRGVVALWFSPCDCQKRNLPKLNSWQASSTFRSANSSVAGC